MEVALDHNTRSNDVESSFGSSEVDTDVVDTAEVGLLKTRKRQHHYADPVVPGHTKADGEPSENSAYLDKYGGAIDDLNIQKVLNSVWHDANDNGEAETAINNVTGEVTEAESEQIEEEIMEEEVVELEFEKAIPKVHTHTMHCPNCNHHITKVVLRRKIIKKKPQVIEEPHEPRVLLGCFSCFSLFSSTDNGGFNPFFIFGKKPTSSAVMGADGHGVLREDENCFSIFRAFRKEKRSEQPWREQLDKDYEQSKPDKVDRDFEPQKPKVDHPSTPATEHQSPNRQGEKGWPNVTGPNESENQPPPLTGGFSSHPHQLHPGVQKPGENESIIDIPQTVSPAIEVPPQGSIGQDSTSFEILKSIVYGGLMEVIASLSIVASASAGGATTLNIIALALANLIGGVLLIGHNIWDLRDDCYKFSTQQTINEELPNKYRELLGSVEHFPLHVFFAIFSFLVFGIIPPVAYGYSFHETNDKDVTMVIVAVASFVCVSLLATFKAYIDRCLASGYVKTIMYYLTTAVMVSGVSYAAGNLVKRLIEELGLFETSSRVGMMVIPGGLSTNPSLAYY